jgi:pyrimidine dimer DNA glycosylase
VQTFLPYANFERSASVLDNQRLGKQRIEAIQILRVNMGLRTGWASHPAAIMWKGFEVALWEYAHECCLEWSRRGYSNRKSYAALDSLYRRFDAPMLLPSWFSDKRVHRAYQSNLVRKNPQHYRQFFPSVPDDLPYVWPRS